MVYEKPPWVFKGKALYQLQLVKSEEARKYIPEQFKLVELFGYTLGGFYLARYEDSPAGTFDELVAMAGLVWNPPTSCAWAARVFVNDREARDHGIRHVGLPSRLGAFKLVPAAAGPAAGGEDASASASGSAGKQARGRSCCSGVPAAPLAASWWQASGTEESGAGGGARRAPAVLELRNVDTGRGRALSTAVCRITLPGPERPLGPRITLSLPSFSGATPEVPGLLRYACDLTTNVGLLPPLAVSVPPPGRGEEESPEHLGRLLCGRPLVALEFAQMEMRVEEPEALLLTTEDQKTSQAPHWAAARAASVTTAWACRGAF